MNGWDIIEAMHSSRWSNTTKLVVLAILLILFVGLFFALRVMIAPTIVGCLLAFVLSHPVNWLQRRTGWGRSAAIVVVYLILVLVLAVMPALFIPRLLDSLDSLQNVFSNLIANLQATSVPLFQFGDFHVELESLLAQVNSALQEGLSTAAAGLFTLALEDRKSVV